MIDTAVRELTPVVGARAACDGVGRSRASHYRAHPVRSVVHAPAPAPPPRARQPRALSAAEQAAVLDVLHSERFVDTAPETVYATLLDEASTCARWRRCTGCCASAGRPVIGAGTLLTRRG